MCSIEGNEKCVQPETFTVADAYWAGEQLDQEQAEQRNKARLALLFNERK
jgi:hypothetical protein